MSKTQSLTDRKDDLCATFAPKRALHKNCTEPSQPSPTTMISVLQSDSKLLKIHSSDNRSSSVALNVAGSIPVSHPKLSNRKQITSEFFLARFARIRCTVSAQLVSGASRPEENSRVFPSQKSFPAAPGATISIPLNHLEVSTCARLRNRLHLFDRSYVAGDINGRS